ncbi:hypothetical protein ACPA9J_08165 [Pseudomonas aeruginosa]
MLDHYDARRSLGAPPDPSVSMNLGLQSYSYGALMDINGRAASCRRVPPATG